VGRFLVMHAPDGTFGTSPRMIDLCNWFFKSNFSEFPGAEKTGELSSVVLEWLCFQKVQAVELEGYLFQGNSSNFLI